MGSFSGAFDENKSQQSSNQRVWGDQSPYLKDLYGQAQGLFSQPSQYTTQGRDMLANYATGGGYGSSPYQYMGGQATDAGQLDTMDTQGRMSKALSGLGDTAFKDNPTFQMEVERHGLGGIGDTGGGGEIGSQRPQVSPTALSDRGAGVGNYATGSGVAGQGTGGYGGGLQDIIGGAQGALNFALDPRNAMNNPYLQQAMGSAVRPLTQNYQENVLSGITDQAAAAGQMGSSRQGIAEGIAARGYMDQVGDITGRMASQNYSDAMGRMSGAINQAQGVANLGMMPATLMEGLGQSQWGDLSRYQNVIGAPTTLGASRGQTEGWGTSTSGSYGG